MTRTEPLKVWRIVANVIDAQTDQRHPFALLNESNTVLRVADRPGILADLGFELGADEVVHEYLVTK